MDEGQEPTEGQAPTQQPPAAPQVGAAGSGGWLDTLPAEAQDYIRQLRDEAAKHRTSAKALADKLQGFEEERLKQSQQWEQLASKRAERIAELEQQVTSQELALLRMKVAQEAGLPSELAARLQGEDEKALKKDAEALLKLLQAPQAGAGLGTPQARPAPNPQRQPQTRGESRRLTL